MLPKYSRVLLKLSGESLMGDRNFGIDPKMLYDTKILLSQHLLEKEVYQKFEALQISDRDLKKYLEQSPEIKASHILFKLDPKADKAQEEKVRKEEHELALVKETILVESRKELSEFKDALTSLLDRTTKYEALLKQESGDKKELKDELQNLVLSISSIQGRLKEESSRIAELSSVKRLQEEQKTLSPKLYKVRPGDTLEKIAKAHKIHLDTLKKLNQLKDDLIVVGQNLQLPE